MTWGKEMKKGQRREERKGTEEQMKGRRDEKDYVKFFSASTSKIRF